MGQPYLPTPASETPSEPFYERETRPARPLSWHPSSQQTHQSLFPLQDTSGNTVLYPFPAYSDADMLAGLQHFPPSPVVYSGYASPAEPFPPLSPAYSSLEVPQMYSPATQSVRVPPQQQQLQEQPALFPPLACSNCASSSTALETPYLPRPRAAQDSPSWDAYPSSCGNALLARSTAPPTPEDFACSLFPDQSLAGTRGGRQPQQQQQQQDTTTTRGSAAGTQPPPALPPPSYQPLIHDDENDDESEGEILYGMGLYDAPDHSKTPSLHQSVVLSLLGGARDQEPDTGKGLGLKLEDAWEPPASEDEEEGAEEDGQGQEEEHNE
ncbi:f79da215-e19e-4dd1-bc53-10de94fd43a0 [Thermothielavioides terrestris]|uniref:F79da215-e19e-4dd1-bc53-10de94fd43a0 n=1 Tax=Thermothielavioides terrestris TaxID=2587410 RepID=A0A446BH59_9PEZI|nr:f79da215-e19e-4dd1-bc53-10de94fd43a0 [Thermothielavioides terrestris]